MTLDITTPTKKVLPKLGYAKKVVKAHSERELQMLWASCMPDEELLFKFFLWSMGREQEVAHSELGDLDFINNTLHICPKPHRNYRLKSKRNRTRAGSRFGSVLDAGGGQCLPQMEADHDHHKRSSGAAPGAKRPAKFFVSRESAHSLTSRERYRPIPSTISPPPLGYGRFRSYARPR